MSKVPGRIVFFIIGRQFPFRHKMGHADAAAGYHSHSVFLPLLAGGFYCDTFFFCLRIRTNSRPVLTQPSEWFKKIGIASSEKRWAITPLIEEMAAAPTPIEETCIPIVLAE